MSRKSTTAEYLLESKIEDLRRSIVGTTNVIDINMRTKLDDEKTLMELIRALDFLKKENNK